MSDSPTKSSPVNFPYMEIAEKLYEDAVDQYGWLSDDLYKTAQPNLNGPGSIYVDQAGSIDLYALLSIVEEMVEDANK